MNADGRRFSDESGGYSEQAVNVLRQPGGIAWNIYDRRIHDFALAFPDYRDAMVAGAVLHAADVAELARITHLPQAPVKETIEGIAAFRHGEEDDSFGRDFTTVPGLEPPFCAVKVTGALFHTQGGLMIDDDARVLRSDGSVFPNLFAGGGAACGVSGPDVSGYLSGNGLLTAIAFGLLAGAAAQGTAAGDAALQLKAHVVRLMNRLDEHPRCFANRPIDWRPARVIKAPIRSAHDRLPRYPPSKQSARPPARGSLRLSTSVDGVRSPSNNYRNRGAC